MFMCNDAELVHEIVFTETLWRYLYDVYLYEFDVALSRDDDV